MGLFSFDTLRGFLLSTNIFQRINKIGEELAKEAPDVIALQEVHTYLVLNLLKIKLSHYPFVAYKNYLYGPRGGLVIFSKHPLTDIEYINFQKRGSLLNKSFVAKVIRNGILTATILKTSMVILNTHLTPNMDYNYSQNNRYSKFSEAQLIQLAQVIKDFVADDKKVLLGGDLNAAKNSYLYKTFLSLSKAIDIFAREDSPTQHQEYYPAHQEVTRIDYIFYAGKSKPKILSADHLFTKKVKLKHEKSTYLSDHVGLKTTIDL